MSSVQFASPSKETHEDNNNERLDLLLTKANTMDPTLNMSLSTDTFLKAALSLKQQVRRLILLEAVVWRWMNNVICVGGRCHVAKRRW